jgi:hypothetical protein
MHTNTSWHCDTFWFFVILDTDAYKSQYKIHHKIPMHIKATTWIKTPVDAHKSPHAIPDTDAYKHRCIEKPIHNPRYRCIV